MTGPLLKVEDLSVIFDVRPQGAWPWTPSLKLHAVSDVSFELGGKSPGIVFTDCDVDKAIEGTMRSVFANCGQVCLGTERVFV